MWNPGWTTCIDANTCSIFLLATCVMAVVSNSINSLVTRMLKIVQATADVKTSSKWDWLMFTDKFLLS